MAPPLSRRGKETIPQLIPVLGHTEPPIYLPAHGRHAPESKRGGVQINLSTAENWLLRPELVPKFRSYIADNLTAQDLSYSTNLGGDPYLLQGLANYFNTNFDPAVPVRPEHIVTAPGASHLLESTFFHICDQGDGVMICTPYWPGFDNALQLHNNIVPIRVDIPFEDQNIDFFGEDTVRFYEEVLQDPVVPIKAMILCNPQNPIGRAYTREALEHILMMAERHDISVVVDELYGMSAFGFEHGDGGEKFTSVLSIDCHEIGVNPGRIHVIYSWSKDLASSGIRMGIMVTQANDLVRKSVGASQQGKVSSFTIMACNGVLHDQECLNFLLQENPKRILRAYRVLESFLDFHKIHYIAPKAGLFAWMKLLPCPGYNSEAELDKGLQNAGVLLNAGKKFHTREPGWFRLVFAVEEPVLIQGLQSMEVALGKSGWAPPGAEVVAADSSNGGPQ